jgi:bifunctional non-homologous end joining protein LigD
VTGGDHDLELGPSADALTHAALMRATLCREPFSDPEWIYERKLDGIRCLLVRDGDAVRMLSPNDLDLQRRYPEIGEAASAQAGSRFAVDGEIVAFDGAQTSFAKLAARGKHRVRVFLYAFDLLWLDGRDLRALPLRTRKRLLRGALSWRDPLRLTAHRNRDGEAMFADACRRGWEGVVAKRCDSAYSDTRSRDWLKFKCEAGQELVIGGFTAPRGSRLEFGALLVGYHDDTDPARPLVYAGKVGTGFDTDTLHSLGAAMRERAVAQPPFADPRSIKERDDKPASKVVRAS